MSVDDKGTKVRILDKEFRINCPQDKERELFDAASYLDKQMRQIRHSGRVIGIERIAIMAALNITNELLALKNKETSQDVGGLRDRLQALHYKIDGALSDPVKGYDKMVPSTDETQQLDLSTLLEAAVEESTE